MTDYPEDILRAAEDVARKVGAIYEIWPIAAALAAERERAKPQPIETAPKDGTPILAIYADGYGLRAYSVRMWATGSWGAAKQGWADEYRQLRIEQPTHWLPLPSLEDTAAIRGEKT